MKISEVRKELRRIAFEKFKNLDYKKVQYGIQKEIGYFRFYIGFGVVDSDITFPSTFHYGVSSKHLNNMLLHIFPEKGYVKNNFAGVYGKKQTQLFDNGEFPVLEYDIEVKNDINIMINDLYEYYTKGAYPFLEKLTDIYELNKFINSQKVLNESMHLPTTLINGLIVSKLSHNPNHKRLESKYKKLIKNWPKWDKEDLNEVVGFLDNHTKEELENISK